MILIANGCSHTSGAEIEKAWQGECYHRAWPQKLGDILGYKPINLSVSGASADRVSRTTIQYIGKLKQRSSFDPSKIFVAIAWPGLFRTELRETKPMEDGFWDEGWMPLVAGNEEVYKRMSSPSAYAYYRAWIMRNEITQESIRFYSNVLLLQNILVSNKIKYVFWNSAESYPLNIIDYSNEIYKKRFPFLLDRGRSFTELLHSAGFKHSKYAKWGHYGEDGQEWFADFLYKYITKENLL